MVILFIARQSTHMHQVPFFLGTKIIGTAQGLSLSCTYPLSNNSWTCHWISFVSFGLVLYVARLGNDAPGIKSIWYSIPLKGGSPEGISTGKTSLNSCKRLVIARGKGVVISSSENNTCLHTKAWKRYINVGRNSKVRFCCKHSMTFQFYSIRTRRWRSLFKFYRGSMLNFRFSSSNFSYCPITLHNFIRCQWKQSNFLSVVHESVFVTSTMVYNISIKLPRMTQ
jgi:hypothetical protein